MTLAKTTNLSRATFCAWLAFLVVSQFLTFFLYMRAYQNPRWFINGTKLDLTDFSQFYQAGQLITSENAHRIYDPAVQEEWSIKFLAPTAPEGIFYNQTVPFVYLFCIPYGKLPYNLAYIAWCLTTQIMAFTALAFLLKQNPDLKTSDKWLLLSGVLASVPCYLTVWHGQTTFLLVAAMSMCTAFALKNKDILSGIFLSLSTVKPQYLLLPLASLAGLSRYKAVAACFICEAVLFALAGLFMGFENILKYPLILIHAENTDKFIGVNPQLMSSLRGALSLIMPHQTAMRIVCALLFLSLIPCALLVRKEPKEASLKAQCLRFKLAFVFTLALVLSPHTHHFDCLLMAIPAALTLKRVNPWAYIDAATPAPQTFEASTWYRLWCLSLIFYPLLSWIFNFALGSHDFEGPFFLALNTVLLISCAKVLQSIFKAVEQPS